MHSEDKSVIQEQKYLDNTISFIQEQLHTEYEEVHTKEEDLISFRREMYENASHHAQDFNKLVETVQYLNPLTMQTMDFEATQQRVQLYERMLASPYFARVDFDTEKWGKDVIYIGIGNLENEDTFESYVYDWRAPIASIFYRYELGTASYDAPAGLIEGQITLKRQYEIEDSELKFFFDSSVNIVDEILKDALAKNTSTKMRSIVETIQREQDLIIRNTEHDLVIVQGVAGSGKTSIALHRAAYLMYQGLQGHLSANDIVLISPNRLFAQYISDVLPTLGEENITTVTFESLFANSVPDNIDFKRRNQVLEEILTVGEEERALLQDNLRFKSSPAFLTLLNRLIHHFEHKMIAFQDVQYEGKILFTRQQLKNRFLDSGSASLSVLVRLGHLESLISDKITRRRPYRLKKLEDFMSSKPERAFDFKTGARLLNAKQVGRIMFYVRSFTRVNFRQLYTHLFSNKKLFYQLAEGLDLPDNMEVIRLHTCKQLGGSTLDYSDAMALFLLRLRMDSSHEKIDIRQVVVDEAQDYSPLHFEILARLYPGAKYTILGDTNQTMVEIDSEGLYAGAIKALHKRKNVTLTLNKSFRCSYEIITFAAQFSDEQIEMEQLDRHEKPPTIFSCNDQQELVTSLLGQLAQWVEDGYQTMAIICKSGREAKRLYQQLLAHWPVNLITDEGSPPLHGTMILPVYLAKGLEFEAVGVVGTDAAACWTQDDRRLLYIATTRALHRLSLFHTGPLSPLIKPPTE